MELEWQKVVQSLNFTIVATLINFGILVALLTWLLYRPVRNFIDRRRERINSRIKESKQRQKEAKELKEKRREELNRAREKRKEIIERAEEAAGSIKEDKKKEAKREAERIIQRAKQEAMQEKQQIREELRSEYLDAAILGAERILSREIEQTDHEELVEDLFQNLQRNGIDF